MSRLRVVLDTNCCVSALARPGAYLMRLRTAWEKGLFAPVMCRETMAELEGVLPRPKFHLSRDKLEWAPVNVRFVAEAMSDGGTAARL